MHTKQNQCEDTRKIPSSRNAKCCQQTTRSQERDIESILPHSSQRKPPLPTPRFQTSSLQNRENRFLSFKSPNLRCSVLASLANQYRHNALFKTTCLPCSQCLLLRDLHWHHTPGIFLPLSFRGNIGILQLIRIFGGNTEACLTQQVSSSLWK